MNTAPPEVDARAPGEFEDPEAGWANDDILFTKPARMALGAKHPAALRVLDWPELRALFGKHEAPANRHGRADRRLGAISVAASVSGLVVGAFSPLAPPALQPVAGGAALALAVGGIGLALFHWLGAHSRSRWLAHRFWTEQARALYFQTLVNNLDLVARAMVDDQAFAEWKVARARALDALPSPEVMPAQLGRLAGDPRPEEAWVLPEWRTASVIPEPSPGLELLLDILRRNRFGIQLAYTDGKLGASLRGPRRSSEAVRIGSDILPAAAVVAAALAGGLMLFGVTASSTAVKALLGLAASGAAVAMGLRLLNDSLLLTDDAGRYAWYSAAVLQARARFDAGGLAEKVEALRDMEIVAYRDLRAFVAAHWRARYVL
ncbi:MAG: hypothetical protein JNK30_00580 [Phenylobacterium sp.]|uniref:hypothetical protein n=1 Tax=Phenylobacterium sp. TaxID=1871053 RepID=UPI001A622875|nr:hypothetical protein [Phenylobacterium sp.]MBL8769849.1 hypothetical protein [Phenylobacterium sp.]